MALLSQTKKLSSVFRTFSTSKSSPSIGGHLLSLKNGPPPALALGAAGLIPFMSAPAYIVQMGEYCPIIGQAQLAYGAVILSFLGGVRWGKLVLPGTSLSPSWNQYIWSVTPSLIAWPALMMPSLPAADLTIVAGLGACCYLDLQQSSYAPWFKGLRIVLTAVAIISLLTTLALSFILEPKKKEENEQ